MTYLVQKRALDLIVALGLVILFFPVWLIVPLLILADSGRPIFFTHKRIGLNGNEFYLYKFRSMVVDADDILHKHDKKLLKKFQTIWVLDTHDSQYAGKLSTNHSFKNIEYIGPKSRFSLYPKTEKTISKVVIISGPEPYSEQFFKSEYSISLKKNEPTVFILPRIYPTELKNKNCEFIESSDWKTCDLIILKAQIIFSRTGYSTIMDIAELNVKSVLIPTKGQKEQEYLFQLTK